jgi:enoyl-CoA hydratase/carnithine racemase
MRLRLVAAAAGVLLLAVAASPALADTETGVANVYVVGGGFSFVDHGQTWSGYTQVEDDRLLGTQRASALLLLGEPLDAATAFEWGFVNRVVDDATLLDTAREMARRLAALPPQAVRLTKRLIRHGAQDVPARMAEEMPLFSERLGSPEAKEAFAAYMEKRKPDFSQFS